jgi:KUP system potassium uptake protein
MARAAAAGQPQSVMALALAAVGVVYGDIGTSPLYTLKETFSEHSGIALNQANVLGILSLILWSVTVVVSLKYVTFVMRADNKGEGGDMALLALALRGLRKRDAARWPLIAVGMCGTALFYGDGMITPAISVLSALEGLAVAAPATFRAGGTAVIVPALLVLIALFLAQRHGTHRVGVAFGPIMVLWFVTLALLGLVQIARTPVVLWALSPTYAVAFIWNQPVIGFLAFGVVILALTGAEAIYADMGHFGRRPIRRAWFGLVFPALMLNYFGQGGLLLEDPTARINPFYKLVPEWGLFPMVGLATMATVIASQAVISGAFSITRQVMQLGYCPRFRVLHTSESAIGQIYIPQVNWILFLCVIFLVLAFNTSSNLAAAYGIAVTGAFLTTTVLAFVVVRRVWGWSAWRAALIVGGFFLVDLVFFSANIVKIPEGGWFPLVAGLALFGLMTTWKRGSEVLTEMRRQDALGIDSFLARITDTSPLRVKGTAVYMTANPYGVPQALLHNLKHNKVLHERVVLATVVTEDVPFVPESDRTELTELEKGFKRIVVRYGFMEQPDVPRALANCVKDGVSFDLMETSFFLGRETLVVARTPKLVRWREKAYIWMARNSISATEFYRIPTNRVVELGAQVEF